MRDEAFVYEDMLRRGGVKTEVNVYRGVPRIFWMVFPMLEDRVRTFGRDLINGFSWLLHREGSELWKRAGEESLGQDG